MRGKTGKIGKLFMMMLCVGVLFGCTPRQKSEKSMKEEETAQSILIEEEQAETGETASEGLSQESRVEVFAEMEYSAPYASWRESRICYADGYYYYVSQMDHYYLYRCKEDGSDPQCLVRAHAGSICVQDDEVFFIDQTDGYGIYRVKTDGTDLTKLCDSGNRLQISAEYV